MVADQSSFPVTEPETFEYDPDAGRYRAIFDFTTAAPSVAVVSAVSAVARSDPLDLEPLYETIDPDALDALVRPRASQGGDVRIEFSVDGYDVSVTSYGRVAVRTARDAQSTE